MTLDQNNGIDVVMHAAKAAEAATELKKEFAYAARAEYMTMDDVLNNLAYLANQIKEEAKS